MTVATSVTAPPTRYTCRALNASFPNPDRIRTVACGAGEPFGGACMSRSASSYASVAAKVALPSPLARPFGAYASMLSSISRYTGGLSTVQSQADSADPLTGSGDATLAVPGRYCCTVAPGTARHASGTWRSSPGWNVVISAPGVTGAGPAPPPVSSTTASTVPATTTRLP